MPAFLNKIGLTAYEVECGRGVRMNDAVAKELRAEAEKYEHNIVIDCQNFVPQLPEFFADKVLHPNDLGFKHYAENLIAQYERSEKR